MKSIIIAILISVLSLSGCKTVEEVSKEESSVDSVEILFCGDVMLDWGIKNVIEKYGYEYPLMELKGLLETSDFRFCNLECPISEEGEPHIDKKYIFLVKPEYVQILTTGGIDGVTLANNHSNDFGKIALLNTMSNLSFCGIRYTGAGMDSESAHLPILIDIRNIRVAIFGYSSIAYKKSYASSTKPGIARASLSLIRRDIKKFRGFNDFIIVSLHWGVEYADYPTDKQREMAHSIIDNGADAVIGHHPHVYQGIEIYKGKPIVYSLGNFIFGSINEDIRDNIIVAIGFVKKGIKYMKIIPINGNRGNKNNLKYGHFQYRLLDKVNAAKLFSHLLDISKPLGSAFPDAAVQEGSFLYYHFIEGEEPYTEKIEKQ